MAGYKIKQVSGVKSATNTFLPPRHFGLFENRAASMIEANALNCKIIFDILWLAKCYNWIFNIIAHRIPTNNSTDIFLHPGHQESSDYL